MRGIEQGIRNRRAPCLKTSRLPDFPATGSMPPDTPQAFFRTVLFARNDLSLAHDEFRLRGFRREVKVPGLLLRSPTRWSHRPVRLPLRNQFPVCPGFGCFLASDPLRYSRRILQTALSISASPREYYLPQDRRLHRPRCQPTHLPELPDLRSLPVARKLLLDLAPDHRSRSATAP